jgi:hypothetical protein
METICNLFYSKSRWEKLLTCFSGSQLTDNFLKNNKLQTKLMARNTIEGYLTYSLDSGKINPV